MIRQIKQIFISMIKKISNAFFQWKNRRLLTRINKVYENGPDPEEKKLLEAYRKSFRKLMEDEW